VRAAGVSCAYALSFAARSKLCSLASPTASAHCTQEGWVCAINPPGPPGGGIHARCMRGRDSIEWQAGF
jgi:hypothetical protein